ncbi:MAG: glycoside hydrolase family 5 protein [Chitinophagaceae bacterium]
MKLKSSFCFAIVILLATLLEAQPVKKHGALKVSGVQLVNAKNEPVVLRGVSYGWHNFWPRFYNEGSVRWLVKDWNINVIRAAMGVEPKDGYLQKAEWSPEKVKTIVDAAIKEGIYVIIDWHSHGIQLEAAKQFFTEMAQTFGQHPNVIYEIFNEPERQSWAEVKAYSEELIKTIRAIDKDNIILVGTPHWDQDVHIAAEDPIKGYDNLMYTLHFYAATHKQELRDRGTYALVKGLPLFISESAGMLHTGDGPLNEKEWLAWIDWAEKAKVSWVTWSVSDKDETCSMLLPTAASDGGWKEGDLKESGRKTRALLRKYNGGK